MEYNAVIKDLKVVGLIIVCLSGIELVNSLILLITPLSLDGDKMILFEIVFSSGIIPLSGKILMIFLIISICCFLILGILFLLISFRNKLDQKLLAKYLVSIGMLILVFSFVKLEYIVLLGRTELILESDSSLTFQEALYSTKVAPVSTAMLWIFFSATVCCTLIIGIVVTASGLKWLLEMEELEKKDSEKKEENSK